MISLGMIVKMCSLLMTKYAELANSSVGLNLIDLLEFEQDNI